MNLILRCFGCLFGLAVAAILFAIILAFGGIYIF